MVYNRKTKDTVFTKVFGETEYAFKLYKVFHPEDTTSTEDQLEIITLENIFTNGPYNDMGLLMNNRLMIFVEAQSKWNDNMPVRTLMYLSETYKRHFIENEIDVLDSARVPIPVPEVYVIFTGERKDKPEYSRLSDHFEKHEKNFNFGKNSLELIVKMIYDSKEGDVVYQYINFCKVFDTQLALYPKNKEKAIKETLKICRDKALLDEFIKKHESEVHDIMSDFIFNEDLLREIHFKSQLKKAVNKGLEKGLKQGMKQGMQQGVKQGLKQGMQQGLEQGMKQGLERGVKQGKKQGMQQGMKQGLEKGSQQKALETAKNLLSHNISLDIISSSTGLPIEQVEALKIA